MSDIKAWHDEIERRKKIAIRIKQNLDRENAVRAKIDRELYVESEIKRIKLAIENSFDEVVDIYKQFDIAIMNKPNNIAALKRSYGTRAGAVITRRGKLRKKLESLND